MRNAVLALVVAISSTLLAFPDAQARDTDRSHRSSLRSDDVKELRRGGEIDPRDSAYCEKARDVCLAVRCGALDRESVNDACWEDCVSRQYEKCRAR